MESWNAPIYRIEFLQYKYWDVIYVEMQAILKITVYGGGPCNRVCELLRPSVTITESLCLQIRAPIQTSCYIMTTALILTMAGLIRWLHHHKAVYYQINKTLLVKWKCLINCLEIRQFANECSLRMQRKYDSWGGVLNTYTHTVIFRTRLNWNPPRGSCARTGFGIFSFHFGYASRNIFFQRIINLDELRAGQHNCWFRGKSCFELLELNINNF